MIGELPYVVTLAPYGFFWFYLCEQSGEIESASIAPEFETLVVTEGWRSLSHGRARVILERRELDALAIVCKAADFERSLFLTFAVLVLDRDADAMGRAKEYGELYAALPKDAAQRTLRFWKMRRQTTDIAA